MATTAALNIAVSLIQTREKAICMKIRIGRAAALQAARTGCEEAVCSDEEDKRVGAPQGQGGEPGLEAGLEK